MTTSLVEEELRDLHTVRCAEIAALREMLVTAAPGNCEFDARLAGRMRDAVTRILQLQRTIARLRE